MPTYPTVTRRVKVRFSEAKATQVACRFVDKSGGQMSHLALAKFLYIVDREALRRWGRPVTGGDYFSLPHGTVISQSLDLMKRIEGFDENAGPWTEHLTKMGNVMRLVKPAGDDELSAAELRLIDEVFEQFKNLDKWQIRDLTHEFGEWTDPHGSRVPIGIDEMLFHAGKKGEEIAAVIDDLRELEKVDSLIEQ